MNHKYTVLLEKVTAEDKETIVVYAPNIQEAIAHAKADTGQSVIQVEEDFFE